MADPIAPVIDRFVSQGSVAGASLLLLRDGARYTIAAFGCKKALKFFTLECYV